MHVVWAGLILGIAAVYGVPLVSSILIAIFGSVSPTIKNYLPAAAYPSPGATGSWVTIIVQILVFGIILGLVIHLLSMIGLHSRRRMA
jgi:hypothetical protein